MQETSSPDRSVVVAVALLVAVAVLWGGGTVAGTTGDLVVQLAALPVLALSLIHFPAWRDLSSVSRAAVAWLGLLLAVLALQLLPLPLDAWSALAGREEVSRELATASLTPAITSTSLYRYATERALWSLLPAISVFLGVLSLPDRDRSLLVRWVIAMATVSVVFGLLQIATGPDGGLRLYDYTHRMDAVGFFANRNHFAALIYIGLVLTAAWLAGLLRERADEQPVGALAIASVALIAMLMIMGLAMARSRAGIAGGMLGLLACIAIVWSLRRPGRRSGSRWVYAVVLAGIACAVQFGLYGILARFEQDPLEDGRWPMLTTTLQAAEHFGSFGSGFGSFINAYQRFETRQNTLSSFVNQAHNDWAQWWLEGSLPAAALAVLFLAWLLAASWTAWRARRQRPSLLAFNRAASIAITLLLLHAFVDYALRTLAIQCIAALLCGLLATAGSDRANRPASAGSTRRHRAARDPAIA